VKLCTQALVFDAYGTLFDVHSVIAAQAHKLPFVSLVILWRRAPNGAWDLVVAARSDT
jgi:FMN phosphatase YigB (HAD superfamily)